MVTTAVPQPRSSPEQVAASPRVVIGVDGSPASVRALVWALGFAEAYDIAVEVVTAWPMHAPVFIGEVPGHFNDARWQAVQAQRRAVEHAGALLGEVPSVVTTVTNALPAAGLLAASVDADLLVLGARCPYPAAPSPETTLAEELQRVAPCPVLEVSALGVVSLPWGEHAFAPSSRAPRRLGGPTGPLAEDYQPWSRSPVRATLGA